MTNFISWILLFCVAMTSVSARQCPIGCSCRGPPSDRHTAICYKEEGPSKDFPPSIKTLEIRHVSAGFMQRYLKHAPDVTDLIIHDSDTGDVQYLPPDFFHGLNNIKALTFQKLKHNVAPQGLAAAMDSLSKLQFLDLTKNRLECSCELLDWLSSHHVMLLGVRNLSPSTHCKEAGFERDTYTSQELIDICESGNLTHIHEVKHNIPESSTAESSKVTEKSSSEVESEEDQGDTEEYIDEEEEYEEEDDEDAEDNQETDNPKYVTESQHQDITQAPIKRGHKEPTTVTPTPEVTNQLFIPPDLENDVSFLRSEYERTNDYRKKLLSLLNARRWSQLYSTPNPTATNFLSNIDKPPTAQATQSPDRINYYDDNIKSILTSPLKAITTTQPSSKIANLATVSELKTDAKTEQGKPVAVTLSPPPPANSDEKSVERLDAEQKPSNDSKHLFLERSSKSGGLGSSILDGPVDVRLHPLDPVELKLLIKYLQDSSNDEKVEH